MMTGALSDRLPERFPYACQWEITCRCNLRCVMCYTDCFNRPDKIRDELSTTEILRIMDEIAEAGCVELCLTGAEPLARPDFLEIYEHAILQGLLMTLFTNGTLVTEELADRLAALPPQQIEISLHSLAEATFESVTQGRGSYQRCMAGIRLLRERRLPLVLKTTALTLNKDDILEVKRYAQSLGSAGYKLGEEVRPTLDGSDAPGRWALSDDELREINAQDPDLWRETCQRTSDPSRTCVSGMRSFHIDAYGYLQLCSGNRQGGYDLRRGLFKDGFYNHLPSFPCQWKPESSPVLLQPVRSHA